MEIQKKGNRFALLLISSGIACMVVPPALDLLKGKALEYGRVQIAVSIFGFVLLVAGMISWKFGFNPLPAIRRISISVWNGIRTSYHKLDDLLAQKTKNKFLPIRTTLPVWNWFDTAVLIAIILFSTLYTLGRWSGISPFVYLGGDASYISSYAAVKDNPQAFSQDKFLSNSGRVASYISLLIPTLQLLNPIVGGYGNAFLLLLPIALIGKMIGFYMLGRSLFKHRGIAVLLTVVTFPVVYTGAWDYWGLLSDALPRNFFEIAFPWVLLLSFKWVNQPRKWLWLSMILGLLTYVHSISAGIIFATISLVYLVQSREPMRGRIFRTLSGALIYLIVIAPFLYLYISAMSAAASVPVSYAEKVAHLYSIYGKNHIDVLPIFETTLITLVKSGLVPLAGIALLYRLFTRRTGDASRPWFWLSSILALIIVAVLLPYLELEFDSTLHLINLQMMLVRGLRYLPPLLILFTFSCFFPNEGENPTRYSTLPQLVGTLFILVTLVMTVKTNEQDPSFLREVKCLASGQFTCPTQQEKDSLEIIQQLDLYTTQSDRILAIPPLNTPFGLSIRYTALRPMGYGMGDVRRNSADVYTQQQMMEALSPWGKLEHADPETVLSSYLGLAKDVNADYLIIQKSDFLPESFEDLKPVFENESYLLVNVSE